MVTKKTVKKKTHGKKATSKKLSTVKKHVSKKNTKTSDKFFHSSISKLLPNKKKGHVKKLERVSTGIKNLDKITGGGFMKNSTNLIVGGSGNGKSIFSLQFLLEGVKRGESVLYITFEEKKDEFYSNMLGLGWDLEKYEKSGKFFFISYTPQKVRTMLEEGGGEIESIVLTQKIDRIAMDSVTAFVMLFKDQVAMREGTLALFSMLRSWTCTSLLIYERDPLIDEREKSRVLEFETDALIFLYYVREKEKRERYLEVYKMRGTDHSKSIYPYFIKTNRGIIVSSRPYQGSLRK